MFAEGYVLSLVAYAESLLLTSALKGVTWAKLAWMKRKRTRIDETSSCQVVLTVRRHTILIMNDSRDGKYYMSDACELQRA